METSKSSGNISRRKRRKKMHLYLIDDNVNTFEYVIELLSLVLPMCNTLRAEQIATIVNGSGECNIYSGFSPEIYILYARLQKAGLDVQIREFNNKNK